MRDRPQMCAVGTSTRQLWAQYKFKHGSLQHVARPQIFLNFMACPAPSRTMSGALSLAWLTYSLSISYNTQYSTQLYIILFHTCLIVPTRLILSSSPSTGTHGLPKPSKTTLYCIHLNHNYVNIDLVPRHI